MSKKKVHEQYSDSGKRICGAKNRKGSPCMKSPMPNGRCYLHGGKSTGAPKGNKNGLKTGEYEHMAKSYLSEEEKAIYDSINTDPLAQLEEQIKLVEIREARMMKRIVDLQKSEQTVTEILETKGGKINQTQTKSVNNKLLVQEIEEALTRVQAHKSKLIEQKHRIISAAAEKNESGALDQLISVLITSQNNNESDE